MTEQPIIKVEGIYKSFGITQALRNVSLEIKQGEIKGLIGENGSGKSTLASIISGNLKPDKGEMWLHSEKYMPENSFDGSESGIAIVVQEQGTIDTISVGANIFAGREKRFCKMGLLNDVQLAEEAQKLLNQIGVNEISAKTRVSSLSFEDRKLVEIARAFYKIPELFIVDETTTALPQKGRKLLYNLIDKVKAAGKSVLFISHDIEEIVNVCDTITILRDGYVTAELYKEEMMPNKMKSLMVGRDIIDDFYRENDDPTPVSEQTMLSVENISYGLLKDISFEVKKGEILGFAGLSESGMHELGKIMFGLIKPDKGQVMSTNKVKVTSPSLAIKNKIGFVSKNRDNESMLISMSIRDNIVISSLNNLKKAGFFIPPKKEKQLADRWLSELNIKAQGIAQSCLELSGGNKQKVVLAKWLANDSDLLILDCPTRGIDVGVKEAIYRIMEELRAQGKSMILISEELPEVIGMSDRIIVLNNGSITNTFTRDSNPTESEVIDFMI